MCVIVIRNEWVGELELGKSPPLSSSTGKSPSADNQLSQQCNASQTMVDHLGRFHEQISGVRMFVRLR